MNEKQWRECLGEMVREYIRSPQMERYFSVRMTKPRAAIARAQEKLPGE
jgi:hypothetical protein